MRVTISVPGTFHAFQLASQLAERDALEQVYTTQPHFKLNHAPELNNRIRSIWYPEILTVLEQYAPFLEYGKMMTRRNMLFDRAVARKLNLDEGIFTGFAGASIHSIRQSQNRGLKTVLERASSHILTQISILSEEYRGRGMTDRPIIETAESGREAVWPNIEEYEETDYIVTPSEFAYQSFINRGFSENKVRCVPFGVDTTQFQPGKPPDIFRALFVGDIGFRKGVPYLLEAWSELNLDNAELVLVGGVDEDIRDLLSCYEQDDSVRVLGWVDEIEKWYSKSSVFVLPSLEEGSAYVTYEAMASGLPLITTFNSGWVGKDNHHGIEVPIQDSTTLADALQHLYENDEMREEMGSAARNLVESEYTWDDYGERIYQVYQHILSN